MKDTDLVFDRNCHVLYSKPCKKAILKYVKIHYPKDKVDEIFTKIQLKYIDYLKDYRTDLGGKKNMHNGVGGTYDSIAVFCYYEIMKDVTSKEEIEKLYEDLFLGSFKKLKFVDFNKKIYKKLMYKAFQGAKKSCDKFKDFDMVIEPYTEGKPIRYHFNTCPTYEFARDYGFLDILPVLCNIDYTAMALLKAKLIRPTTLSNGNCCDYIFYGDKDPRISEFEEFRDEFGGRRDRKINTNKNVKS